MVRARSATMSPAQLLRIAVFSLVPLLVSGAARGYTIKNEFSDGCHEKITTAALRAVRGELPTAAPLPASANDQALIDDLQFTPDADMGDLGGATLLIGVRDNDLKGRSSDDLTQLAAIHGNPDAQEEHCLRSLTQDEPTGSAEAVASCMAFVRGRIQEALAGLDAAGKPDPTNVTTVTVELSLRGQVNAPLPTYYLRMGQAIHAIEDSFTHTYRTSDETQITVVLNWIDKVGGGLVESRDGPAHAAQLDRCDDPDALRTTRHTLAVDAATEVLRATLDPTQTPDQKMAAVDAALQKYMGYSTGCTFDNGWCDAPERQYADSGCGCRVGKVEGGLGALLAAALAFGLAGVRRTRRLRARRAGAALGAAGAVMLTAGNARAEPPATPTTTTTTTIPAATPSTPPTTEKVVTSPLTTTTTVTAPTQPDVHAPPPPSLVVVQEPGSRDPNATTWGAAINGSGSIDKPAVAGGAGLRLHLSKQWSFGLDGEWNPWLALNGTTVHAGSVNVYGSAMLRFPLAYENFNVRTTVSLGASYLLSNLYGAPTGSVGPYGSVSFLGLEWKLSRTFLFVINPVNVSLPMPQIRGVPLMYPQYRIMVGLEVYAG
jgi:hypothetical protein